MSREMSRASSEDAACKRRKIFRACQQCVHAKTRCEDILPSGCALCRRRSKDCSLAGALGAVDVPRDEGTFDTEREGSLHRPEGESTTRLEQRLAAVEEQLRAIQSHATVFPPPVSRGGGGAALGGRWGTACDDLESATAPILSIGAQAPGVSYGEAMFALQPRTSPYPCVVKQGIYSAEQVDMAFHAFKHGISKTCPLSPWLSSGTPTPRHPFVVLAMLQHLPLFASGQLADMVEESMMVTMTGASCEEAVLALLILSLAPTLPLDTTARNRPTALKYISLAYDTGRDLGLGVHVARTARCRDLGERHWHEGLVQLEMWAAVVNQYNLLHILYSYPHSLVPAFEYRLESAPAASMQCMQHLRSARVLVEHAFSALAALLEMEIECMDDVRAGLLNTAWEQALAALHNLRFDGPTADALNVNKIACEQTLLLRLSTFLVSMPIPLGRLRDIIRPSLSHIIPACLATLHFLIPDTSAPPARLLWPSHVLHAASLAAMSLLAAAAVIAVTDPGHPFDVLDPPRVRIIVRLLKESGTVMRILISQIEEKYGSADDWGKVVTQQQVTSHGDIAAGNVAGLVGQGAGLQPFGASNPPHAVDFGAVDPLASLFDFNMAGWDFLLPEWTPGSQLGYAEQNHGLGYTQSQAPQGQGQRWSGSAAAP